MSTQTYPSKCPLCSKEFDMLYSMTEGPIKPKEGDFSFCLECESPLRFDAEGQLRAPSVEELEFELQEHPQLRAILDHAAEIARQTKELRKKEDWGEIQ